jgi:hypothetical protein
MQVRNVTAQVNSIGEKAWSHISTPPFVFEAWCLIMHRENIAYVTSALACIMIFSKSLTIGAERALLEKLTVPELVKKFDAVYGPENSLPRSQQPATCPYPEPDQSISQLLPVLFLENLF